MTTNNEKLDMLKTYLSGELIPNNITPFEIAVELNNSNNKEVNDIFNLYKLKLKEEQILCENLFDKLQKLSLNDSEKIDKRLALTALYFYNAAYIKNHQPLSFDMIVLANKILEENINIKSKNAKKKERRRNKKLEVKEI